ncbi:MAG: NAD-dependent epimerase/dehydratase family protein [Nitrospirae bacterium]|nr:MAG: NAD-dependent epimerase/dehydratase family protein [Nitrospirota bacterium]
MSRTALVTGATGFLGRNLVERLLAEGWRVRAYHRPGSDTAWLAERGVELACGVLTDAEALAAAVPEGGVVFHLAGDTTMWPPHHRRQYVTNVLGTRAAAEAALRRGARLVHASSIAAYGIQDGAVTEESPRLGTKAPIHYFRTKALAEEEVERAAARGLDAVVLQPANIVGRHDTRNWSRMIRMVAEGKLPGVPPGGGSFCHAAEAARTFLVAAERAPSGSQYLLGGADASYLEVVRLLGRLLGRPAPRRATPAVLLHVAARIALWLSYLSRREPDLTPETVRLVSSWITCRSDLAVAELGYRPVPLEAMFSDAVSWMREAGLLPGPETSQPGPQGTTSRPNRRRSSPRR